MTARAEKPRLPPIATKPVGHIPIVGTPLLRPQSLRVPFRGDPPPRRPPGPATEPTPSPTRRLTAEAWDDSARCVLKTSFLMAFQRLDTRNGTLGASLPRNPARRRTVGWVLQDERFARPCLTCSGVSPPVRRRRRTALLSRGSVCLRACLIRAAFSQVLGTLFERRRCQGLQGWPSDNSCAGDAGTPASLATAN